MRAIYLGVLLSERSNRPGLSAGFPAHRINRVLGYPDRDAL